MIYCPKLSYQEEANCDICDTKYSRVLPDILQAESHTVAWPDVLYDGDVVLPALEVGETAGGWHQETV